MKTLREITGPDDDVWSLEEDGGELFLTHAFDDQESTRSCIPITALALELMAIAARNQTPIHDARQNVVAFPKVVPVAPGITRRFS